MALPITMPKFKIVNPIAKLVFSLLAVYAVQAIWAHYVVGKDMSPTEWFSWWFDKLITVARWLNAQWNARKGTTP